MLLKMNCLSGRAAERGTKTRMPLNAHDGPLDHAEYGPMTADETHVADEVELGRLTVFVGDRLVEVGNHCKVVLVSLALQKGGHREGEWAPREQTP